MSFVVVGSDAIDSRSVWSALRIVVCVFVCSLCSGSCAHLNLASAERPALNPTELEELPDFSFAGYAYGEREIPTTLGTVIDVTDFGVVPDDGIDDSIALISALDAAHQIEGKVTFQLPKGRLEVSEILFIERGDFVIRGHGSGQGGTDLHFPRPLKMVDKTDRLSELREYLVSENKRQRDVSKNINEYFSEYSWTGGFIWIQKPDARSASYLSKYDKAAAPLTRITSGKRGSQSIEVDATSQLRVGDAVQILWFNKDGQDGPLIKSIYGDTNLEVGSRHWSHTDRPLVRQITRIVSIDDNKVEIGNPLLHDIGDSLPAQISSWNHLEQVGLEDFSISFPNAPSFGHHLEQGYNGIYFTSTIDGWVRDIRIDNADSGILTYNSANLTVANVITTGNRVAHYAVHLGNVHNVLVEDLVVENPVIHSLTFNTQATRNVYKNAVVRQAAVLDQHAGANHQNLFDNVTLHVQAQRKFGSPFYSVWNGSGAPYWQPGHGLYNTTWNLNVIVEGGATRDETVTLEGLEEGPGAFIIGIRGNRDFIIDYRPAPLELNANTRVTPISLYDWQLRERLSKTRAPR